jgi:hypothetical protein
MKVRNPNGFFAALIGRTMQGLWENYERGRTLYCQAGCGRARLIGEIKMLWAAA